MWQRSRLRKLRRLWRVERQIGRFQSTQIPFNAAAPALSIARFLLSGILEQDSKRVDCTHENP